MFEIEPEFVQTSKLKLFQFKFIYIYIKIEQLSGANWARCAFETDSYSVAIYVFFFWEGVGGREDCILG